MIEPTIASVRPRVVVGGARGVVLLEDLVLEMAASGLVRAIELIGPPGFGTTTALQHLASVLGTDTGLVFIDGQAIGLRKKVAGAIVFPKFRPDPVVLQFKLAGWGRDEWIEYLLKVHKSQCSSVMTRVLNDNVIQSLEGNPSILALVLDELAGDDRLPNVKSALIRIIDRHFPGGVLQAGITDVVQLIIPFMRDELPDIGEAAFVMNSAPNRKLSAEQIRLLGVRLIRLYFATEIAWYYLTTRSPSAYFRCRWPHRLISSVAARLVESPTFQEVPRSWIVADDRRLHPLAVSLLHAAGVDWELPKVVYSLFRRKGVNLDGAILDGADCTGKLLAGCSMQNASFQQANLSNGELAEVNAKGTDFDRADLSGTELNHFVGLSARFVGANLSGSHGHHVQLGDSDLSRANLSDTKFHRSNFSNAILHQADLRRARLKWCDFRGADLDDADFTGSDLTNSTLAGLDLTSATFFKAKFGEASMNKCNLERMELADADFSGASLEEAELTGSILPRANFSAANLRYAKLADIDWECADLSDADLTGATFHMGSSRSGLIASSVPMEGSRTGFYTDELNEQDFKAPEEIRKANLRAADLRGAIIKGVDFYLVDLRDACYDSSQIDQLRRTGAILESHEP